MFDIFRPAIVDILVFFFRYFKYHRIFVEGFVLWIIFTGGSIGLIRLSYIVANKHSKQAMFAGFAGDVRTLLPGEAKQPKKLNHSYHLLSFL